MLREMALTASYVYDGLTWRAKSLFAHPFTGEAFPVPRIVPSACSVMAELSSLVSEVDLAVDMQGRVVQRGLAEALKYMIARDHDVMWPPLSVFDAANDGRHKFSVVLQIDGARRGKRGFVTLAAKNRYLDSQAAIRLIFLGFGTNVCSDNREGFRMLLGQPNLEFIHGVIASGLLDTGLGVTVRAEVICVSDAKGARGCEGCINGYCACTGNAAMHAVFDASKVQTKETAMSYIAKLCHRPTGAEQWAWSHRRPPGAEVTPCTKCTFGHSADPEAEMAADEAAYAEMLADDTVQGKARLARKCLEHAHVHGVKWGAAGEPCLGNGIAAWCVDLLHAIPINSANQTFKHTVRKRMEDAPIARAKISDLFDRCGQPLNMKTKAEGRISGEKWFGGGDVNTLFFGGKGKGGNSPGGPAVLAEVCLIMAEERARVRAIAAKAKAAAPPPRPAAASKGIAKPSKSKGPSTTSMAASADGAKAGAKAAEAVRQHRKVPEVELRADQGALAFVTEILGVDAQEILNVALTWDAYFAWHFHMYTRLAPDADDAAIDAHGLAALHTAIAWKQMFEEASDHASNSWYPHLAMAVVPISIWTWRSDLWDLSMSALELSHALTGRVLDRTSVKRITLNETTLSTQAPKLGKEGPARLVAPYKATATMATSCFKRVVALGLLQDDPERRIDTAVTRRVSLAPELGGGRKTARHTAPVLGMAPVDLSVTTLVHLQILIQGKLELNSSWPNLV